MLSWPCKSEGNKSVAGIRKSFKNKGALIFQNDFHNEKHNYEEFPLIRKSCHNSAEKSLICLKLQYIDIDGSLNSDSQNLS